MRLQFHQLSAHLERSLAPLYLICGDEPLQLGDAAKAVREAAGRQGFAERELLEQDAAFEWERLADAGRELSLFSARKLIELRLGARVGREGSDALCAYCADPPPDNLLLILGPHLEYKELKARWVQAVERAGVLLQVRQVEGRQLVSWIEQRMGARGLRPEPGVAAMLAERVEGNLLAAAQEVEKLLLLYGPGALDREGLTRAVSDSARYDLFDLPDAALSGDRTRVQRILRGLAAEGAAEPLVLWAIARELRMLTAAAFAAQKGTGQLAKVFADHKVWESRQGLARQALKRLPLEVLQRLVSACGRVDRQIKGVERGDPWLGLARIADVLAGGGPPQKHLG